ncbi:DciA family protein [Sphaerotilus microaerophilus]|uniref:DciA family protein n=1 Tax=Sphaerotilus microaerophilus TaxID=2914710 RepID=UPI002072A7CD|nr:DciA family protein [Sphaerotilus sp. FB-5]
MKTGKPVAVPDATPLRRALERCEPLLRLQQRLAAAHARMDAIRTFLPPGLAPFVKPGPVEDSGWTLFATGPAVAAKLRQMQPLLETALRQQGFEISSIKIRVQSTRSR